jgi:hypothetical protein
MYQTCANPIFAEQTEIKTFSEIEKQLSLFWFANACKPVFCKFTIHCSFCPSYEKIPVFAPGRGPAIVFL